MQWLRPLLRLLDPPTEHTWFDDHRSLTRDRTPHPHPRRSNDVDEYVYTVYASQGQLKAALREAGYAPNHLSTYKYVWSRNGGISWERGTMARNRLSTGGEVMQHAYWFEGADDAIHAHHHREWPISNPSKHWGGSRTHSDPDDALRAALEMGGLSFDVLEDARYPR